MSARGQLAIDDCQRCMKTTQQYQRMSLGCGYEPPADGRVHLAVWQPPGGSAGYDGKPLTTCAGYTTNLPEVAEAIFAHVHWNKGNLQMRDAPEQLLHAIVILEGAYNQVRAWINTPSKDGGGGA